MGRQTQAERQTAQRDTTPVRDSIIEEIADEYDLDADTLREFLVSVQNDISEFDLLGHMHEQHDFKGVQRGVAVFLADFTEEVSELGEHTEADLGVADRPDVSAGAILRACWDRAAKRQYWSAFGSEQEAVGAVGHGDAILISVEVDGDA